MMPLAQGFFDGFENFLVLLRHDCVHLFGLRDVGFEIPDGVLPGLEALNEEEAYIAGGLRDGIGGAAG